MVGIYAKAPRISKARFHPELTKAKEENKKQQFQSAITILFARTPPENV